MQMLELDLDEWLLDHIMTNLRCVLINVCDPSLTEPGLHLSCNKVILMEKDRREFLKKMRNPRADALQKSATMKKVRDKCKLSCCPAVITKMVWLKCQSRIDSGS